MVSEVMQRHVATHEALRRFSALTDGQVLKLRDYLFLPPYPDLRNRAAAVFRVTGGADLQNDSNRVAFLEAFFTHFHADAYILLEALTEALSVRIEQEVAESQVQRVGQLRLFAASIPALLAVAVWAEEENCNNSLFEQELPRVLARLLFLFIQARVMATGTARELSESLDVRVSGYLSGIIAAYFHVNSKEVTAREVGVGRARRMFAAIYGVPATEFPAPVPSGAAAQMAAEFVHKAFNLLPFETQTHIIATGLGEIDSK